MIRVLFLYHDLMNLYGENGNIRVLERYLKDQGEDVQVDRRTVGDDLKINDYDFIYCGCGTEKNRNVALKHLNQYKEDLKASFNDNKVILFTGNSYQMLGKSIKLADGNTLEGLGLFDFTVTEQDKKRYTGDVLCKSDMFEEIFVGFMNKCSHIENLQDPFLKINKCIGNVPDKTDGIHQNNLFGMQLSGPVLSKNPHFAKYIIKKLVKDYKEKEYINERKSYEITISELTKD